MNPPDLVAVGHTRDPLGDVVVEGDLAVSDQLQDEVGGERLSLAGDLELHVGVQRLSSGEIGNAGRAVKRSSGTPDADQNAWGAVRVLTLMRSAK
jgi:hypothetical protein